VPNYQEIYYEKLYDGIDLRYYSIKKDLKYDFIVHPGAEIEQIRIKCKGASDLVVEAQELLKIKTSIGEIIDRDLKIYQLENNKQKTINGAFKKYNEFEYGFEILSPYDKDRPLIIDPILEYSTFFGGGSTEYPQRIDVDTSGNAYVTGYTYSSNFPITNGSYDETKSNRTDSYVFKMAHNGSTLIYSTFIGGVHHDYASDIKIDPIGNSYITGTTRSTDFPTTPNAYDSTANNSMNVFVFKLDPQGSKLKYSTFIHGTDVGGDQGFAIDIDSFGYAYVSGFTYSKDFPTTSGSYDTKHNNGSDIFVLKLNRTGERLIYSTFVGGNGLDISYGIAVDNVGDAYITGETYSSTFPISSGAFDSVLNGSTDTFIFKLNYNGSGLVFSTLIGGDLNEKGYSIKVNSTGFPIICGETGSSNFPTTNGIIDPSYNNLDDCFVLKLNKDGKSLIFSTFIGGTGMDLAADLALDSSENIFITGETSSADFPKTQDAYNNIIQSFDAFLMKLTPDASYVIYSTYMGGRLSDGGFGIDVDITDSVYVLGTTTSSDFPYTPGAYDGGYTGNTDGVIFKFSFKSTLTINSVSLLQNGTHTSKIYSELEKYTFRINLIHSATLSDLKDVFLILDPNGVNIKFKWDYNSRQFTKESDPDQYVILEPSSTDNNINHFWTIDFDVTFDWDYPDENLTDIQIFASSLSLPDAWLNSTDFYRVENDLEFNGTLSITDENNETVLENDLVKAGTKLNWTGLKVVYQNTSDIYPTSESIQIRIKDSSGHFWFSPHNPGEDFLIQTITNSVTNIDGEIYSINIIGIPQKCDASNISTCIRVDGDNVTFSDILPINNTWHTKQKVFVSVNISDPGGEVDSQTVSRSISTDNGNSWSDWVKIYGLESNESIIIQNAVTFIEGTQNLLKWSAMDTVGNGPTESQPISIKVDTKPVNFSDAWPTHEAVSTTENVELKITISDDNSGVNASSIYYKIFEAEDETWGDWIHVDGYEDGASVSVNIVHTFPNGTNNMVKWRATDIAGNEPRESSYYIVNVDTWQPITKPSTVLLSPLNGQNVNRTEIELSWELANQSMGGVLFDLYLDSVTPPALNESEISDTNFIIKGLENDTEYFWYVIPKLGNISGICSSGIWSFKVQFDVKKNDSIDDKDQWDIWISGPKDVSMYAGENKTIELNITNLGNIQDTIILEFEANILTKYMRFSNNIIPDLESKGFTIRSLLIDIPKHVEHDTYEIIITAISMGSEYQVKNDHIITLEIKAQNEIDNNGSGVEDNSTDGNGSKDGGSNYHLDNNMMFYFLLAIVLLVTIILIIGFIVLKRKKRVEQQVLEQQTVTIKPRAIQTSVGVQQPTSTPTVNTNLTVNLPSNTLEQTNMPLTTGPSIEQPQKIEPTKTTLQMPQASKSPQLPPAKVTEQSPITITTSTPIIEKTGVGQKTQKYNKVTPKVQQMSPQIQSQKFPNQQTQSKPTQEITQQEISDTTQPMKTVQNSNEDNNDT